MGKQKTGLRVTTESCWGAGGGGQPTHTHNEFSSSIGEIKVKFAEKCAIVSLTYLFSLSPPLLALS
jgi:hypothetical protein